MSDETGYGGHDVDEAQRIVSNLTAGFHNSAISQRAWRTLYEVFAKARLYDEIKKEDVTHVTD